MRTVLFLLSASLLAAGSSAAQTLTAVPATAASDAYGGKTIVTATVACTDVLTDAEPVATLRVVAPHASDPHQSSARGELVVLSGGTPAGFLVGQRYFARRFKSPPDLAAVGPAALGSIRTTGWITVVAADEHSALARVDYACTAVDAGDYLEPFVEPVLPPAASPAGKPNFADMARVLFGSDRRETFGAGDLLSIDRGSSKGIAAGARVTFYRDRGMGTPLFEVGTGIVMEVAGETAKVVVDRSAGPVRHGDYVATRQ